MLCIPIATTFRYGHGRRTFGYCYPNRQWFIQEYRHYDPWNNIILDKTEEMDGFRFVPTTIRQTNEKLKTYLKKELKGKLPLPDRLRLASCYTHCMNLDNNMCFQTSIGGAYDSSSELLLPNTKRQGNLHRSVHRPNYDTPSGHISVEMGKIVYKQKDGGFGWWYSYKDFDSRKHSDMVLSSVAFEVNILRHLEDTRPAVVRWSLSAKYDYDKKELIWDTDKCFMSFLFPCQVYISGQDHAYHIENRTPYGSRGLDIPEVYEASAVNATKIVDTLVTRFF